MTLEKTVDPLMTSLLLNSYNLDSVDLDSITKFLRVVEQANIKYDKVLLETLREKTILQDDRAFVEKVADKLDSTVYSTERDTSKLSDTQGVFDLTESTNIGVQLTDSELRDMAKKLGLSDIIC